MNAKKTIPWLALLCMVAAGTVSAHGHGHHHHRPRLSVGVYFGVPFAVPWGVTYGHAWYAPPLHYTYLSPPLVIVRPPPEPQVYIERAAPQSYWHYCSNPPGYYPYVRQCPGGWMQVVPAPPPN